MLTADAFGVLPPISPADARAGDVPLPVRLHRQARRHRARRRHRAQATFSTCFGAPFLPRPRPSTPRCWPERIARARRHVLAGQHRLVRRRLRRRQAHVAAGDPQTAVGGARRRARRHRIRHRAHFGLSVPKSVDGVDDTSAAARTDLGRQGRLQGDGGKASALFDENFRKLGPEAAAVVSAGIAKTNAA